MDIVLQKQIYFTKHVITSGATAVVLYNAFHHLAPASFADVPLDLAGAGYLLDHPLLWLVPPILLMKLAYYGGISLGVLWPDIDIETSTSIHCEMSTAA
jgi:hypothetical protein